MNSSPNTATRFKPGNPGRPKGSRNKSTIAREMAKAARVCRCADCGSADVLSVLFRGNGGMIALCRECRSVRDVTIAQSKDIEIQSLRGKVAALEAEASKWRAARDALRELGIEL